MISIKSNQEMDLMKKAGYVVALVLEKMNKNIKPGITTGELDKIAEETIVKSGGIPSFKGYSNPMGDFDFPSSICASVNNEVVHGIPGQRELKNGDIISIDVGVYLNGYHGDAARTFAVGNISDKAKKLIDITRESFYRGILFAIDGNRIIDISTAVQNYVEENGFSIVRDYVGHGIGSKMHEPPQIPNYKTKERGPRLRTGMTIAIEPMVNEGDYPVRVIGNKWTVVTFDGSLSAHYENTIAITKKEPVILTKL